MNGDVMPPAGSPLLFKSPGEVEAAANKIRKTAAPTILPPGEIKTMDDIIRELEIIDRETNLALRLVRDADKIRANAKADLRRQVANMQVAQKGVKGTAAEKSAAVVVAVEEQQVTADVADVAYRYAKATAEWLEGRKSSLQTQSKLVQATYQMAGTNRHER